MFDAMQAQKAVQKYMTKLSKDHARTYDKMKEKESEEAGTLWKTRGQLLVNKIEGYIKKAASIGHNYTLEPTTTNPYGDQIIYLGEGDWPIYKMLMEHFRGQGYLVEEYQYHGMKITW
jgi:hypothetical protein